MTATTGTSVAIEPSGERSEVLCSTTTNEISIGPIVEEDVRAVTRKVLDEYDRLETEGLTDRMYQEAPYDFQRHYRELDKTIQSQLRCLSDEAVDFDREPIRQHLHAFLSSFPDQEFSEYLNDLYLWYDLVSTALDDGNISLGEVEDIVEIFWTIVMLDLATSAETGITPQAFGRELGIDDSEGLQEFLHHRLGELETELLHVEEPSEHAFDAADAIMVSHLESINI